MEKKKKGITRWLIPGFIFQSVTIGGGYGTGAEIAQYFGASGMVGGLLSALVTLVIWAVMCAVTFEFVRVFKTYDYGSMMKELLGKAGFLYDILYYVMMFIVLGVLNATAGSMINALTGASSWIGVIILAAGVFVLVFLGTEAIEKVLSFWSYVLYAVYIVFLIAVMVKFGGNISAEFAKGEIAPNWFTNGANYALYNLVVVPLILYTVRDCDTRKEAVGSGVLAGIIGVVPGILLLLVMGADFANVTAAETPVTVIFDLLNMRWLYIIFEIVLFGTLIETGTGFIKAFTDRIETSITRSGKELAPWVHPALTVGMVIIGILISTFGLLNLIVKGYGTSVWGFLFIYAIPMLTYGVYKIVKATKNQA
ncbi:MAG: hypothetical protein J5961_00715 [Mogibacterium sp.]|nr:hypothetical protein [Mogibacterium sp.]